ncbi:MAG: tRNA pseudouridine(13) synthase TruD, partial [Myxococcales bacterium]|nr:tRNA pseudouridine(13) synthase TruD [Myxococcales bacterium]
MTTAEPSPPSPLPYLTATLPGIGGRLRSENSDFAVEEISAYLPCGEGDHVYVWIEKREMTTVHAIRELGKCLDIRESDIGAAGMKDRYAVTRQMLSLPPPTTPEAALACEIDGLKILSAERHGNKLKTGHLKGNRFVLRVRDLNCPAQEAVTRSQAILECLSNVPGAPNWYGAQRFGRGGGNASVGKALVMKTKTPGKPPRGRQRRLFISAYQSQLFNECLAERMRDGLFETVLAGDLLQKRDSGGVFATDTPEEDQVRFTAGEVGLSGPMFGHRMKMPSEDSPALEREVRILEREKLSLESFSHLGKLANGARRPMSILLQDAEV